MSELQPHPFAEIFPLLDGAAFDQLVADVAAHGVLEPVTLLDGRILDGRNRWRAAQAAGVPCPTRVYEGDDPLGFVVSANLHRRHLNASQRALVAARLATLPHGRHKTGKFAALPTQGEAAALLNVSERSVRSAAEVRDEGVDDLVDAVERGAMAASVAADIAALSKQEQLALLACCDEVAVLRAAKTIRGRKVEARLAEARRLNAERTDGGGTVDDLVALAASGYRAGALLVDPPWRFKVYSGAGKERSADRHYGTMDIEELKALPVAALAADDCVLFLWSLGCQLPDALDLIKAWGFQHQTDAFTWAKQNPSGEGFSLGMGFWTRSNPERCLLATKGKPQRLAMDVPELVVAPVREHSRKPDEIHGRIERLVGGPYLELFARQRRPGWTSWGAELATLDVAS